MESMFVLFVTSDMMYAKALVKAIGEVDKTVIFEIYDEKTLDLNSESLRNNSGHITLVLTEGLNEHKIEKLSRILDRNVDLCISEAHQTHDLKRVVGNEYYVNKYVSAETMLRYMNLSYNTKYKKRRNEVFDVSCQYVYFCSSCGGTGKTTVALGLAQELVRYHGKKVLYINYEDFDSSYKYLPQEEGPTLEYFMVGANREKDLESYLQEDIYGIKYFSMGNKKNPLKSLNSKELIDFLEALNADGDFEYIFIDGTERLADEEEMLLKKCNAVCQIEVDKRKKNGFSAYIKRIIGENCVNKLIHVKNFSDVGEEEKDNSINYIGYDDNIFLNKKELEIGIIKDGISAKCWNIDIDGEFGVGIKELSKRFTLI